MTRFAALSSTRASTPTCGGPETAASRCGRRHAGPASSEGRTAAPAAPPAQAVALRRCTRGRALPALAPLDPRRVCASCAGTGRRSRTSTGSSPACSCRPTPSSADCSRCIATRCSRSRRRCGGCAQGPCPPAAVALTIDDGFHGTLRHAWPALQRHGFPATLYATSYHVQSGTPVFRLLVQWVFRGEPRAGARPVAARGGDGGRTADDGPGAEPHRGDVAAHPARRGATVRARAPGPRRSRRCGARRRPRPSARGSLAVAGQHRGAAASPLARAWTCSSTPTATASPPHGSWRCASCVTTARCSSPPPATRSATSATRVATTVRCTCRGWRRPASRARPPATRG